MLWEVARLGIFIFIFFFAAINSGFLYKYNSQINEKTWVDAFFRYYSEGSLLNKESTKQADNNLASLDGSNLNDVDLNSKSSPDSLSVKSNFPVEKNSIDSSLIKKDTLALKKDTVKVDSMAIDSTARLKYFTYQRHDVPYVKLGMQTGSEFFAQPSSSVAQRTIEIDSTGKYVDVKETIAGQQTKILLHLPIDEYLKLQLALKQRSLWYDLVNGSYSYKGNKKELGEVIKGLTNFDIPLPSVGLLSIFGKPKISLRIGGSVDIHGAWVSQTTEGLTASALGNTTNEPNFQQQVQINVNGTIGDKLNIDADWNTERTFDYQNQLKIKYTGYEDEIVQNVEAGNVSMQTTPLIGGSEALFGVKGDLKFGPLTLTALASQKKGQTKEITANGGATSQTFNLRAYQYATNNYFLDTTYASEDPSRNYFFNYYGYATPKIDPTVRVVDIQVWKSTNTLIKDPSKERIANAYINLKPRFATDPPYPDSLRGNLTNPTPGQVETGRFILLTPGVDYILHPETGYITLNTPVQDQDVIAVAYRVENGPGPDDDYYYGDFLSTVGADTSKNLVLKLVKPQYLKPSYTQAWKLLLKNIYYLGASNINQNGFVFNIKYEIPGQDPVINLPTSSGTVQLLNAFGLDSYDASGTNPTPDGIFDWRDSLTILPGAGEIIFPHLQPFGKDLNSKLPDSVAFQAVYDTTQYFAGQDRNHDRWELTGQYTGTSTSIYQLGFNLVENSVRVTLNGRELTAGIDYSVDYNMGQLTILNRDALVPGADLKVTYEQNDLFQLASKTLVGARAVLNFDKSTRLGATIMNLNQQTLSDKVQIGEEPMSNTIMGLDFSTNKELPFLTSALDHIVSTKEMSSLSLSGEYALMKPNPNTKTSTITDDKGQSVAYIDDFEGTKKIIPLGVQYTGWKDLSPPDSLPGLPGLDPQQKLFYKAKAFWYTITPSRVTVQMIWPKKQVAAQDNREPVLDYVFMPDTPGTYNYNPILTDPKKTWGGMMTVLPPTATDLQAQNINYIEFYLNLREVPPGSKLYIDLGRISEDVLANGVLGTEDKNGNGVLEPGEDTGIDGMTNAQEKQYCIAHGYSAASKADPSGDDFSFNASLPDNTDAQQFVKYFNINGTEGNSVLTDVGRIPDTEDLNQNGNLDVVNSYFRYAIPLDTNVATNPYIAGGGDNAGWYLIRVPLKDTLLTIGNPSLSNVQYIRVFSANEPSLVHIRLAEFNLVGSQWQAATANDSVMTVSVVNLQDNPNYTMPPGLQQERDYSNPNQTILLNEQSMDLIINNLQNGVSREAVKYLYNPLDVFDYKQMKLFIHGDTTPGASISDSTGGGYPALVYFRFGTDTNNFYEYSQPVQPGWNDITIDFSKITALKTQKDTSNVSALLRMPVVGEPGHYYGVKGSPTLTAVKFLDVGITNISSSTKRGARPLSGEVWIDELRVLGADNHPGVAYSIATSLKLADIGTINFNMSHTDPYFHGLSDRFGSRVDTKNWSISTNINLIKLLPFRLDGSNFNVSYTHSESVGKPLYLPGTDVNATGAAQLADQALRDTSIKSSNRESGSQMLSDIQTINVSDTWSLSSIGIRIPSSSWITKYTINALNFGFNYNKNFSRNPTILSNRSWLWNASMNYAINFSPDNYISPANIPYIGTFFNFLKDYRNLRIYFTPQTFSFNVTASRNYNQTVNRQVGSTPAATNLAHNFLASRGFNFLWKLTDGGLLNLTANYSATVNSSLDYLQLDNNGNIRPESEIWHDIFTKAFFGRDYNYQQNVDIRSTPKLPSIWNLDRYLNLTASYSVVYQWNNNFSQENAGRSAGFQSRTNLGLRLSLKSLMDPLFEGSSENTNPYSVNPETNRGEEVARRNFAESRMGVPMVMDTSAARSVNTIDTSKVVKKSPLKDAMLVLSTITRVLFFDYESINLNFTNSNSAARTGLVGEGSGFLNFWGFSFHESAGPSRLFMLGLNSSVGNREPNLTLTDNFNQSNQLTLSTSKPLWEGARIDLNWNVSWSDNKSISMSTDSNGIPFNPFYTETGSLSRSFFTVPPVFLLSAFKSGIKRVSELYDPHSANPSQSLSTAFTQGFESMPWLSKLPFLKNFAEFIPRPNWSITWDGLEKIYPFKSIAEHASLEHAYTSTYTEGWYINPNGDKITQTQHIDYGFNPLIGLNITFKKLWNGNFSGNIKYSTRDSYDLGVSTQSIAENYQRDIGVTFSYTRSGFEIPLFGVSLKNDVEVSFSYTNSLSNPINYDMSNYVDGGVPQNGSSRVIIQPRIKYTISSRVTISIFYTKTSTQPVGASTTVPIVTNEAGLDVHISIQ